MTTTARLRDYADIVGALDLRDKVILLTGASTGVRGLKFSGGPTAALGILSCGRYVDVSR
jgi:hypothetical protein